MTVPAKKPQSVGNYLNMPATQKFLEDNLKEKRSEFVSNLLALADNDKNIAECDPNELMMCAMNATAVNLALNKNLGHAYVIAYNKKPSFQIGTKGWKQLAMRSNSYKTLNHCNIREGELTLNKFTGNFVFHEEKPDKPIVGYFAFFELLNGYTKCLYMTNEELEAHAIKYVPLYRSDKAKGTKLSKWSTDERHFMENKTVIKLLLSRDGLLSTEMQKALDSDSDVDNSKSFGSNIEDATIIPQEDGKKNVKLSDLKGK